MGSAEKAKYMGAGKHGTGGAKEVVNEAVDNAAKYASQAESVAETYAG